MSKAKVEKQKLQVRLKEYRAAVTALARVRSAIAKKRRAMARSKACRAIAGQY
jgi:hypothetical protein